MLRSVEVIDRATGRTYAVVLDAASDEAAGLAAMRDGRVVGRVLPAVEEGRQVAGSDEGVPQKRGGRVWRYCLLGAVVWCAVMLTLVYHFLTGPWIGSGSRANPPSVRGR